MNEEEKIELIIRDVGHYRKLDDIILELCEKYGGTWNENAEFVKRVMATQQDKIQASRQPLLTVIGVVMVIAGLGGTIGSLALTLDGWVLIIGGVPFLGNIMMFGFGAAALIGGLRGLLHIDLTPTQNTR